MTCQTCGRPAENGVPTHWLGCPGIPETGRLMEAFEDHNHLWPETACEYGDCAKPKREGSGKGAPPKYCEAHSNPKNRK